MNAGCTSFDHHFDQLEYVQRPSEAGFSVGDNWSEPVDCGFPVRMIDLVRTLQCLSNALYEMWNAVGWVQALVRINLAREICVGRDLPAANVNRFQPGA